LLGEPCWNDRMLRLLIAVCLLALPGAAEGSPEPAPPRVRVAVDVYEWYTGDWRVVVYPDGSMRGNIGESKFSVKRLDDRTLERIRGLAQCVVAIPAPVLGACPIKTPPAPITLLNVTVGTTSRGAETCAFSSEGDLTDAQPTLALLLEMRALVGGKLGYDYRPWIVPILDTLPEHDPRCPWLAERQ
jgi:hypothetical protein